MADLFAILNGASTSLAAQRALIAVASHNIDNSANPDYARQIATLEAIVPAEYVNGSAIGRGSTLQTVTQARDRFIEQQLPAAFGNAARSAAEADALNGFHGLDPEASGGLGPALSGFYASLTALAQNPSDNGLRAAFFGVARQLAQTFNRTSGEIDASRSGLDAKGSALADQINSEAAAVAQLNVEVARARNTSGAEPNDLLDLRQKHVDKLAQLAGATPIPTGQGDVQVVLPGGLALVSGDKASTMTYQADAGNGGHLAFSLKSFDGSSSALSDAALGGSLGGVLAARDGALATAASQVDQLAYDVAGALNAVHQAGYGTDGSTGNPLFDVGAMASGAAAHMALAITSAAQIATAATANAPGDAANVNALLATSTAPLTGGHDVQGTISVITSQFGAATTTAQAFSDQDGAVRDNLSSLRASASGVSVDQEMITLQQAQRGYEAISKVIQVADQMLETLMNIK